MKTTKRFAKTRGLKIERIELLAHERDGKSVPSGHFRRGEPGEAPYSKNRAFYNP
jgi:hypothetical protein